MARPILWAAAAVALAIATGATAQQIYKYRTPDGKTVYSDKPVPGATLQEEFVPAPAPDPAVAAAREKAARAQVREANERAAERSRALEAVTAEVDAAAAALERARATLEAGREPSEGDRTGIVARGKGGIQRSRLNEDYWLRQAENEQAVADAEARLERARRALNELR
jgi:hypothetical protein